MNVFCPNFSNEEVVKQFEELINKVGENKTYYLWNKYEGDYGAILRDIASHPSYKGPSGSSSKHYVFDVEKLKRKYGGLAKTIETNEKLRKGIKQRLATIQRYQTKNIQTIRETQRLIDQLNRLDAIEGVIEFVNYVQDNITTAFEFLNNPYEDINSTQIVQLKRDYLGFFIPMMQDIKNVIDTTDELKGIEDYDVFKSMVNDIVSGQVTLMNTYQNILNQKTRDMLIGYAESAGSTTVDQLINWLEDPNKDLNWFDEFLGQNSSAGNEVFRIMTDMLNNSIA